MQRFRKKIVEVEAVQFTKDVQLYDLVDWGVVGRFNDNGDLEIWNTLEECYVRCPVNHWIIRGLKGEFYPCESELFIELYDPVEGPCSP